LYFVFPGDYDVLLADIVKMQQIEEITGMVLLGGTDCWCAEYAPLLIHITPA